MSEFNKFEIEFAGRTLVLETGKLANQATSSVAARYGQTVVLATVVMSKSVREGIDFFPLLVDYEERMYAAGKIMGSRFIKREGRPSEEAVLTSRLADRCLRPLFPEELKNDVQVILTVLSVDGENDPDLVSILAASAALHISSIPWDGPVSAVRVGLDSSGKFILNSTYAQRAESSLDIVVSSREDRVVMLEARGSQVKEDKVLEAIEYAIEQSKPLVQLIEKMREEIGEEKFSLEKEPETKDEEAEDEELERAKNEAQGLIKGRVLDELFAKPLRSKEERLELLSSIKDEIEEFLIGKQIGKEKRKKILDGFDKVVENEICRMILEDGRRVDGRALDEVRELSVETQVLPRTHGSALFQRGDTQVLSIVTLGSPGDEQTLEGMEETGKKRYMHHYNFPPFCVGEVSPLKTVGRREIGHGALAERALLSVLPSKEDFPYTIRVVSEVLSSNGSSSMASACCSSLALMDAGVPIAEHVAGIAMGLASTKDGIAKGKWKIITDLQDLEDGKGGMDFKVAGTRGGITAIQMDTKTSGLTLEIVGKTLTMALEARLKILDEMEKIIDKPKAHLSPYAPRISTITISTEKIRDLIGPGGKVINDIIQKTGAKIDIDNSGLVVVTSENNEAMEKAMSLIKDIVREVKVGEVFSGKVTRIMDFGAFVEILPRQEGLVHISNLANHRVENVTDVVKPGDSVEVEVIQIDDQGRINLKMKGVDRLNSMRREDSRPRRSGGGRPRFERGARR